MARCGIFKFHAFLLALIIALTIAEDSEPAERKDVMRTARCEHHDHDEKPPSKWLAKFKRTKHYGSSKSQQHRQKTHYGQPDAYFRPPPQYVRTQTNYNIPSYHPPAIPSPPTSYPHPQNPHVLPQHSYSPVKIYSSPPAQVQSFNHPPHLPPTEAPPTYTSAPYSQDPEEVEGYSLLGLVHNPPVPHSPPQVPVSPVNIYGYPYSSQAPNFNRPAHQSPHHEAPVIPSTYSNAPSHQDLEHLSSPTPVDIPSAPYNPPQVPLSSVKVHNYPSQVQHFNLAPDSSTEAPVPSTYSNIPYRQDPVIDPEIPTVSNPSAVSEVSSASYDPPSPNHLEIPVPDPPATPVSTAATIVNQTISYYSNAPYAGNYNVPTTTAANPQEAAKTEKVPYTSRRPSRRPSKAPTSAPPTYSSSPAVTTTTERTTYITSPSYSDFENPPVSSTTAFNPAPTSHDPSTYSAPVTEAPAYFPPYFGDDFDSHSFDDPYPEPEPPSYFPPKFPDFDDSPFFLEESQNLSPPVYSEDPFQKANSRPSSAADQIPDYYSHNDEDEKDDWKDDDDDAEEFFQQGKFPRFDEFIKQMMSIGKK